MNGYNYLDGNAVTYLWDKYVDYKKEGQTGDDLSLSPFRDTVLSEYTVDEFITIPINNTYKKHLLFMTIFPNIPVFKSITAFSEKELNMANPIDIIAAPEFLGNIAQKRAKALIFLQDLKDLEKDIENKENGKRIVQSSLKKDASGRTVYAEPGSRISIKDAITKIIVEKRLSPHNSAYDFHILCMNLYVATRDRLINVPARLRKGPKQMLNHQIDFYHLSYLPFVDGFITGDEYLSIVAREIVTYLKLQIKVGDEKTYWSTWLRNLLAGK